MNDARRSSHATADRLTGWKPYDRRNKLVNNMLQPLRRADGENIYFPQMRILPNFKPSLYEAEMQLPSHQINKFLKNEEGAALAEYGILVAFIAIVAITAVTFFGSKVSAKFSQLGNTFS